MPVAACVALQICPAAEMKSGLAHARLLSCVCIICFFRAAQSPDLSFTVFATS